VSRPWSLRNRLIALIALAAVLTWVLSSLWLYRGVVRETERLFDAALIETAHSLLAVVVHELDDEGEDETEIELESVDHAHRESLYFQVRDAQGRILFRSPGSPVAALGRKHETGMVNRQVGGVGYRIYTLARSESGVRIDVAQPLSDRTQVVRASALRLLLPGLVLVLALALCVYAIVRQVVAPIMLYCAAIDQLQPGAMQLPAGEALPRELRPVTDAIDSLARRVDAAFLHERTLTADAAHELRTPLAALRAQAQVALRSRDDDERRAALLALIEGVDRSTRVVESVLSLARLDAREFDVEALDEIALHDLTQAIAEEFRGQAKRRGLDLTVSVVPLFLRADADACAVLLRNLLDNALRHARQRIELSLIARGDSAVWRVQDDGPGMSAEQRQRAFDRFYRASGSGGAGLGLAMVQRVAQLHRGDATIIDGLDGAGVGVAAWLR
jgi:two-component system, OmpR family, sensor histidine kinase QseC